jgi:predicted molibdopterin-dependent oxidoreductase YjgC
MGEARPEWEVFLELASRVRPVSIADKLKFKNTEEMREKIALINPQYAGIQHLKEAGDQF